MRCAGDLLVFGAYNQALVINFEDHSGAHGGLGGPQQFPFMVAPRSIDYPFSSISDSAELNAIFSSRYQMNGKSERRQTKVARSPIDLPDAAAG
jgi:hypothetical protein